MPETVGSGAGFIIGLLRSLSHILLLLLHNLIFIAIAAGLLYGLFRLGRSGVRQLHRRGTEGAGSERPAARPEPAPQQPAPAAAQSPAAPEQGALAMQRAESAPEPIPSVIRESNYSPREGEAAPPNSAAAPGQAEMGQGQAQSQPARQDSSEPFRG